MLTTDVLTAVLEIILGGQYDTVTNWDYHNVASQTFIVNLSKFENIAAMTVAREEFVTFDFSILVSQC